MVESMRGAVKMKQGRSKMKTGWRRVFGRVTAIALVLVMCIFTEIPVAYAADSTDSATVLVSVKYGQTEARSMLDMVNDFRTGSEAWAWDSTDTTKVEYSNLGELVYDYELEKVAMQRAAEIALSFSHIRPNGDGCFTAITGNYYGYGENIAAGYTTASSVFEGWKETDDSYSGQGHRRNMLGKSFTRIGIGHVVYNGTHYWVQELGYAPSGSTTATDACDTNKDVDVEIALSSLKAVTVTAGSSACNLSVGASVAPTDVTVKIRFDDTWPERDCTVSADCEWKIADTSVAAIVNGKITGKKAGTTNMTATVLGKTVTVSVTVNTCQHVSKKTVTKATTSSNGKIVETCVNCGKTIKTTTIYYPKNVTLSAATYTYNGTVNRPTVKVTDSKGATVSSQYYTVSYPSGRKNVGKYTVTVTFKGNYSGKKTATFTIRPVRTSILSTTAKSKGFTVKWSKKTTQTSGYQIQYSTKNSFPESVTKTVTVRDNKTTSKSITGLKANTKYYVRVRTYKDVTIDGKQTKIVSEWSGAKTVRTK